MNPDKERVIFANGSGAEGVMYTASRWIATTQGARVGENFPTRGRTKPPCRSVGHPIFRPGHLFKIQNDTQRTTRSIINSDDCPISCI